MASSGVITCGGGTALGSPGGGAGDCGVATRSCGGGDVSRGCTGAAGVAAFGSGGTAAGPVFEAVAGVVALGGASAGAVFAAVAGSGAAAFGAAVSGVLRVTPLSLSTRSLTARFSASDWT